MGGAIKSCVAMHHQSAVIAGVFSVAYSLRFTVDVFFGPTATDLFLDGKSPELIEPNPFPKGYQ